MTSLKFPYDVYTLNVDQLSHHTVARLKQLLQKDCMPTEVCSVIEDELIPALEYIENWEPSDAQIMESNHLSIPWHDSI